MNGQLKISLEPLPFEPNDLVAFPANSHPRKQIISDADYCSLASRNQSKRKNQKQFLKNNIELTIRAAELDAGGGGEEAISASFTGVTVGDQQRFGLIVFERVVTVRI